MNVLDDLEARGLIHDTTDRHALAARLAEGPIAAYYGCDPSADSLHVGNLVGLVVLRRLQDAGHRPIALAGGATGMVGDPGGRSSERNLLDEETLLANVAAIKGQMARIIDFDAGPNGAVLVDNRDWTGELRLLSFLRDVGKHVTVNKMLARDSVRARLESEQGISFTEFSYMLLQANDYLWLFDHLDCELQIGGSDQWGNIVSGVDLVRRVRGEAVHALSWPLLTAPDGSKLGKTTGASIWLSPRRTSPYRFFQHWMQTDDRQLGTFLAQFTLLPMPEVDAAVAAHVEAPGRREGQRLLARKVTALVHGAEAARTAEAASALLFGSSLEGIDAATMASIAGEIPTTEVAAADLDDGLDLAELLVRSGAATSKGDARRLVAQGGISVNGRVASTGATVTAADAHHGRYLLVRRGKAYHLVIVRT